MLDTTSYSGSEFPKFHVVKVLRVFVIILLYSCGILSSLCTVCIPFPLQKLLAASRGLLLKLLWWVAPIFLHHSLQLVLQLTWEIFLFLPTHQHHLAAPQPPWPTHQQGRGKPLLVLHPNQYLPQLCPSASGLPGLQIHLLSWGGKRHFLHEKPWKRFLTFSLESLSVLNLCICGLKHEPRENWNPARMLMQNRSTLKVAVVWQTSTNCLKNVE